MTMCNECNQCHKPQDECGCARPVLEVTRRDDDSLVLKFNVNGVTTEYDFADLIRSGQSDTSLSVEVAKRVLKYVAEKHIDSLSAAELGSILHLGDLGDVDAKKAETGSQLVYKKDDTCAEGCVGTSNHWEVWNALDNTNANLTYISGYNAAGSPLALRRPTDPSKYSLLGWNAENQVSWLPFTTRSSKVPGDYAVYADRSTHQLYFVEEN